MPRRGTRAQLVNAVTLGLLRKYEDELDWDADIDPKKTRAYVASLSRSEVEQLYLDIQLSPGPPKQLRLLFGAEAKLAWEARAMIERGLSERNVSGRLSRKVGISEDAMRQRLRRMRVH